MQVLLFLSISTLSLITVGHGLSNKPEIALDSIKTMEPEAIKALLQRGQEVKNRLAASRDLGVTPLGEVVTRPKLDAEDIYALKLCEWVSKNQRVQSSSGRFSLLKKNVICFPKGCINLSDVGVHP